MYSRRQLKKMLSETPINISRIHYLSSGDDSDVYLCDQKYVLKIPLRESVKKSKRANLNCIAFWRHRISHSKFQRRSGAAGILI